jgi:hypothetical protein
MYGILVIAADQLLRLLNYSSPIQIVEFLNILPRINKIKFPNFGTGSVQLLQ